MCAGNSSKPKGMATSVMIAAWTTRGRELLERPADQQRRP